MLTIKRYFALAYYYMHRKKRSILSPTFDGIFKAYEVTTGLYIFYFLLNLGIIKNMDFKSIIILIVIGCLVFFAMEDVLFPIEELKKEAETLTEKEKKYAGWIVYGVLHFYYIIFACVTWFAVKDPS